MFWLVVPFKWRTLGPHDIRYCAIADFAKEIRQADGDYKFAEIDDDKAIVRMRISDSLKSQILANSDVQTLETDRPQDYWTPTRISTITGETMPVKSLGDLNKYLLGEKEWSDLKYLAESLMVKSDIEGYQRIDRGDWKLTVQLLILLGRAGYGLNKISTGTFPTTSVLDNFDRANANNLGANWSTLYNWSGSTNYGIISNTCYNDLVSNYSSFYYNVSTYGADCEAFWTLSTKWAGTPSDIMSVHLRAKEPGANFDGYQVAVEMNSSPEDFTLYRDDNHVSTSIAGPIEQAFSAGDKLGGEIIGDSLTGYIYTGGAWSAVINDTDATYSLAGYIGFYGTGSDVDWRIDDFGGGTVVAAGGSTIPIYKKYYDYRRSQ